MIKRLFLILAVIAASATCLTAQSFAPNQKIPADPEVRVGKLDNGMTYYIRHNAKPEKQGEFYIFHNVGAIQEEDSQIGLAHFLEHMAFNGTKNLPDKMLLNYLETVGVKFGYNLNAGTGQDMTVYNISSVPLTREGITDTALLILHDWSHFITLEPDEIDKERGVIVEELRTGNDAWFRVQEKTNPVTFNNSKYAKRNVIGDEEHLRSFSHQELIDFYHRWYRPDLQALVLVGDFDVDQMEAKVKKIMADIPAVENPEPKQFYQIPDNDNPLVGIATDPELTSSNVRYLIKHEPIPNEINDTYMASMLNLVNRMTATMANHRFFEITQKPSAPFVSARCAVGFYTTTMDVFSGNLTARDGETAKAFEAFYSEIEKIRRYGFTEGEFERVKAEFLRNAEQQYDNRNDRRNSEFVWTYISNYYKNAPMPSAETNWEMDSTLISSLDLMTINAYAQQVLLKATNEVVVIISPEKEGVAVPSEQDVLNIITTVRASEIAAPEGETVKEPLISENLKGGKVKTTGSNHFGATEWTLSNGAKVIIKQTDFKADEVVMNVNSRGGMSILSDEDYSSAEMLNTLVSLSGVGKFSAADLRKQLAGKSVNVYPSISNYENAIAGSASVKDFETMLQLTYLYLTSPRFNKDDFDMMIDKYETVLSNAAKNPDYIFGDSVNKTIYGRNIRRMQISSERLKLVNFDRMEAIYKQLFSNADDFIFTFVGNINPEEVKPLIEKYIGSLPATKAKLTWKDDKVRIVNGQVTNRFEAEMQAPKTTVLYYYSGEIPYTLENMISLNVLKSILDIRYNESIREEKGGTYGVGVGQRTNGYPVQGYTLMMQFDTDPKLADELMEIVSDEVEKIAKEGPLAADLNKTKEYLVKQRPDDLKKNNVWLNYIDSYYINGIDLNTDYDKLVAELSADKIKALAAKIIADNNLIKIIMDPKKTE